MTDHREKLNGILHLLDFTAWEHMHVCGTFDFIVFMVIYCHSVDFGRTVGPVVKALDSQPRDRGFESRRTLSVLYLESLGKICTRNVPRFTQLQMRTWQYTENAIVY